MPLRVMRGGRHVMPSCESPLSSLRNDGLRVVKEERGCDCAVLFLTIWIQRGTASVSAPLL